MRSREVLIDRGLVLNIPQLNLQISNFYYCAAFKALTYQVDLTSLLGVYGAVVPL